MKASTDDRQLTRVARFIGQRIDELSSRKAQREIAQQAGFKAPNIMFMFKQGLTKVPLDRVLDLARALEVDPRVLFELVLEQVYGEGSNPVTEIFHGVIPSAQEAALIRAMRKHLSEGEIKRLPKDSDDPGYDALMGSLRNYLEQLDPNGDRAARNKNDK